MIPLEELKAAHARAEWPRKLGMMFAALGLLAAVVRSTAAPWLPRLVPVTLIVIALGLMGISIIRRARALRRLR